MIYQNNRHIAILLATYNGAKYLHAQLDSLLSQTCMDFSVYIHDDGSSDETPQIINDYVTRYPDRFIVLEDFEEKGRGATGSFIWLMKHVESDFYMFCDQDDIWLPSKIMISFNRILCEMALAPHLPMMVYSDLMLIDEFGESMGQTLWEKTKMKSTWYDTINANYVWLGRYWGCTILFNRTARNLALPFDCRVYGHDIWMGTVVNKNRGKCIAINECTIKYRQHTHNASGGVPSFDGTTYYKKQIGRLASFIANNRQMYHLSKAILGCTRLQFVRAKMYLILSRFF